MQGEIIMKKIIILFSSLIVSFSLLFFYSNYKLNAMDSAVTNEQELINAINGNNNVVLSNDITISGQLPFQARIQARLNQMELLEL